MSIRDWCKQNGLTEQQFYYRLRYVREAILESLESPQSAPLVRILCIDNWQQLEDEQSHVGIIVRYHSNDSGVPCKHRRKYNCGSDK